MDAATGHHDLRPPSGPPREGEPRETPAEGAHRLEALAVRIEEFLRLQMERLEQVMADCRAVLEREESVRRLQSELEQERERRLQEREQELDHLREDGRRLREAWERLEAEQRRLLARRPEENAQRAGGSVSGDEEVPSRDPERQLGARPVGAERSADRPTESRQPTLVEFQQLRREIRKHARRRGT